MLAQISPDSAYPSIGVQTQFSYTGGDIDTINPSNGNVYYHIPLVSIPQKGDLSLNYFLQYNSGAWNAYMNCIDSGSCLYYYSNEPQPIWVNIATGQGGGAGESLTLSNNLNVSGVDTTEDVSLSQCTDPSGCYYPVTIAGTVSDGMGIQHGMGYDPDDNSLRSNDGSGYRMSSIKSAVVTPLTDSHGRTYNFNGADTVIKDLNGNSITLPAYGGLGQFIDSWGNSIPGWTPLTSTQAMADCPNLGNPTETVNSAYVWNIPGPNSTTQTFIICYTNIHMVTNFPYVYPASSQYCGPNYLCNLDVHVQEVQSVVLPDGTYWGFTYDTATSSNPYAYGDITQVTYPTGATISYQFATSTTNNGCNSHYLTSRTTNDMQGNIATWTYALPTATAVKDPDGNKTVYTYNSSGACSSYETSRSYYQGSNTLLREVDTQSSSIEDPAQNSIYYVTNILPTTVKTTTPAGNTNTNYSYDALSTDQHYVINDQYYLGFANPPILVIDPMGIINTETVNYEMPTTTVVNDYNNGPVLKNLTDKREAQNTNSPYYAANLLNLVQESDVSDSISYFTTTYRYDEAGLGPTCLIYSVCGNQTSHIQVDPSGVLPSNRRTVSYLSDGFVNKSTDANANALSPDDSVFPGGTTQYTPDALHLYAQQTTLPTTTNGVSHSPSQAIDPYTGRLVSKTDDNLAVTHYYYYPFGAADGGRLQQIVYPDNATINYSYVDTPGAASITDSMITDQTSGLTLVHVRYLDGFGRVITETTTDSGCTSGYHTVSTTYDLVGRVASVTNPYCATTDPTYSVTSFHYDALGRKTSEMHSDDGSWKQWCYDNQQVDTLQTNCQSKSSGVTGDWVDYTDESGNYRQYTYDALARLRAVVEPTSPLTITKYTYNAIGSLTGVAQASGSSVINRTFTYDAFGRLATSFNPEAGMITYTRIGCINSGSGYQCNTPVSGYDPNGNLISKTDARGVATKYTYDALNRITGKSYPGTDTISTTTPSSCYVYDIPSTAGTDSYSIGQLTFEWTQLGGCNYIVPPSNYPPTSYQTLRTILAYDPMGRVTSESQCTPTNCNTSQPFQLNYNYDLAGYRTMYTNGVGSFYFNQGYDAMGRLSSITSSWQDSTHPANLFNVDSFGPAGWTASDMGFSSSAISSQQTFDSRMRIGSLTVTK
jgi:YD repeat-containing protein